MLGFDIDGRRAPPRRLGAAVLEESNRAFTFL
ncbi:hypothetical protein BPC006_II0723 [Burkholderia pseudomallei BPC006]|nr:hypothetical protein BPC006_II0723 [Burkholderia pseudomallei BPC006]